MKLPAGLEPVEGPRGWGFAAPEAWEWVSLALARGLRLRDVAAAQADALELVGRGPVYAVPAETAGGETRGSAIAAAPTPRGRWVVRPYRRGGLLAAPLLGDRYARGGVPRPIAEARASFEARLRGVATPRVLAGALYPAGAFYRADIVTQYIADSRDLADALFRSPEAERLPRSLVLREAGRLVGRMAAVGVEHPDLNARNILLAREGEALVAMLLDLDRCRVRRPGSPASAAVMLRRLERSLRKIARASGVSLPDAELAELRAAVAAA